MCTGVEIAAIIGAVAAVGTSAYTISGAGQSSPSAIATSVPTPAPPPPALPPAFAPVNAVQSSEQDARKKAVQKIRELQSRQSAPSTALSAPLGVAPASGLSSTVLGR